MQTNPLNPTTANKPEIIKITGLTTNQVYGMFNGKAKKQIVTPTEFCIAKYCTWQGITMNNLEEIVKQRSNKKTNWYQSSQDGLIRYNEISNNEPYFMLFTQQGEYVNGSAELEDRTEEIKKLLFP